MSKVIEDAAKEAAGALKKIRAAKGRLKGNFYYAGDTRGSAAGLVVTLQARDPKGSKATASGKAVRKEIKGAKFARGIVSTSGSQLLFELYAGSASKEHMKLGFKKSLAEKSGLAFLKKALLKKGGDPEDTPESSGGSDSADETIEDVLDGIDAAELATLVGAQDSLAALNDELDAFLADDTEEEVGEQLAAQLKDLDVLYSARPRDETKIAEARRALAELAYTGPDPFPAVGTPLTPEMREVLAASINSAVKSLDGFMRKAIAEIEKIHATVRADGAPEDESKRKAMLESLSLNTTSMMAYREQLHTNLVSESSAPRA